MGAHATCAAWACMRALHAEMAQLVAEPSPQMSATPGESQAIAEQYMPKLEQASGMELDIEDVHARSFTLKFRCELLGGGGFIWGHRFLHAAACSWQQSFVWCAQHMAGGVVLCCCAPWTQQHCWHGKGAMLAAGSNRDSRMASPAHHSVTITAYGRAAAAAAVHTGFGSTTRAACTY